MACSTTDQTRIFNAMTLDRQHLPAFSSALFIKRTEPLTVDGKRPDHRLLQHRFMAAKTGTAQIPQWRNARDRRCDRFISERNRRYCITSARQSTRPSRFSGQQETPPFLQPIGKEPQEFRACNSPIAEVESMSKQNAKTPRHHSLQAH